MNSAAKDIRLLLIQSDTAASRAVELYLQGLTKNVQIRTASSVEELPAANRGEWDAIILDVDDENPEQMSLVKESERLFVTHPVIRLGRKTDHLITSGAETAMDESLNKIIVGAAPLLRSISHLLERRRLERKVEELEQQLAQAGNIDSASGLYGESYLIDRLSNNLEASLRYKHPLTVCFFEIAKFDFIDDAYGFTTANEVLKTCGGIVQESIRKTDYAGRVGTAQFGICFPNTALPSALIAIERLRDGMARKVFSAKTCENFTIDVNYGVCQLQAEDANLEKFLAGARKALQGSKAVRSGHIEIGEPIPMAG